MYNKLQNTQTCINLLTTQDYCMDTNLSKNQLNHKFRNKKDCTLWLRANKISLNSKKVNQITNFEMKKIVH